MAYHLNLNVKDNPIKDGPHGPQKGIRPILFLSKLLTDAKIRYWPTELEIAAFI